MIIILLQSSKGFFELGNLQLGQYIGSSGHCSCHNVGSRMRENLGLMLYCLSKLLLVLIEILNFVIRKCIEFFLVNVDRVCSEDFRTSSAIDSTTIL